MTNPESNPPAEATRVIEETAAYLDRLEDALIATDGDMFLPEGFAPPSIAAENLRGLLASSGASDHQSGIPAAVVPSNPPAGIEREAIVRIIKDAANGYIRDETAADRILSLLASRPAGVGEPVAWQFERGGCKPAGAYWVKCVSDAFPVGGPGELRNITPLYAAPTPAASPADGLVAYLDTLNGVLKNAGVDLTALGMEWPTAIAHKYRAAASPDWQVVREAFDDLIECAKDSRYSSEAIGLGFRARLEKIAAALASPPTVAGWRPLLENGVRPKGRVLLWKERTKEHYVASWTHGDHPGWCTPDGFEIFGATHWQPLPSAPIPEGPK